jgi:hypothetical protein
MGSWIRIQKGENQPQKRRKLKAEDQKKNLGVISMQSFKAKNLV